MQKKIVRPTPKWKFAAGILLAFVTLMAATLLFSLLCSPSLSEKGKDHTPEEIAENPRSRSTRLRVFERRKED